MKSKIKYMLFLAVCIIANTACEEMDNYDAPNASFGGVVIDKTTGKGISTEQPNGFRIRWTELTWGDNVQPDYFYGMPDGKFNWDYAFGYKDAQYEIAPVEGAFVTPEPQIISLKKGERKKDLVFEVIPYIHIDSEYELNGRDLTVRFTATRPEGSVAEGGTPYPISRVMLLISNKTQYIGYVNTGGFIRELSKTVSPFRENQLGEETTVTARLDTTGIYHFRLMIQTGNPNNACNYTPVEKVEVQQ